MEWRCDRRAIRYGAALFSSDRMCVLMQHSAVDDLDDRFRHARTMTILVVVFSELLRAFTSRSLRSSIFQIGLFSNRVMTYAVLGIAGLTIALTAIPGLNVS